MANKVTLTATDGSTVEFYDEIKAQGGVKDVYFSVDKTYVVAFYRKAINANDKARINDIVNIHRNRIFTSDAVGQYWTAFCMANENSRVERLDRYRHTFLR